MATLKEEIVVGSEVVIDLNQPDADEHTRKCLFAWHAAYSWPMVVYVRFPEHVVLKDKNGEIVHFGSTADARFNVGHVKLP